MARHASTQGNTSLRLGVFSYMSQGWLATEGKPSTRPAPCEAQSTEAPSVGGNPDPLESGRDFSDDESYDNKDMHELQGHDKPGVLLTHLNNFLVS